MGSENCARGNWRIKKKTTHKKWGHQEGKFPVSDLKALSGFKIGYLNVCSLTHQIEQLRLDLPRTIFDTFTISETWLNKTIKTKLTSIPNYRFLRTDRKTKL